MSPSYLQITKEKYPLMTKGLKTVADHLMSDSILFAVHPAKVAGKKIGVSETMIIRFCNEIGYKGFRDFQQDVRAHLLHSNYHATDDNTDVQYEDNPFIKNILEDVTQIKQNIHQMDWNNIHQVVETILTSNRRMIVGYYHSFTYAHWFSVYLNYYLGDTILYRQEDDVGLIETMPSDSVVFIFSYFRYATDSIRIAKQAKEKGLTVISMTDSLSSPICEHSDIVIPLVFDKSKGIINKAPVTYSIINTILTEIAKRDHQTESKLPTAKKFFIQEGD